MCGCNKKSFSALGSNGSGVAAQATPYVGGQLNVNDMCDQDNMVRVRYDGPVGNHLVGSPLRKFRTYGMHTRGDVFCVHRDDQRTAPAVFVLLEEPKPDPEPAGEPAAVVDEEEPAAAPVEKKRKARKGE